MDCDLYPDVAAAGSLAALLERTAAGLGIALAVTPRAPGSLTAARIASSTPGREPLSVYIDEAPRRRFGIAGRSGSNQLIGGGTTDLAAVVRAGVAWGAGRSLREMAAELPFECAVEFADALAQGAAAVVALQWRHVREHAARTEDFPEFTALVEAAHAEPRLRRLSVYLSHWTVAFSSCTDFPFRDEVAVTPSPNGPYYVRDNPLYNSPGKEPLSRVLAEAPSAAEAVALAAGHLPADLGPAVLGRGLDDD
ncbi:DUF6193 family natural product biosynthesis protein [Kitasatospora sp. NPDC059160]|uniref:DUF6193 family natural product biosynthesis protein n=1 Tax=Kitasatospora sp. NPDC059160 TaxID=3346748 RepID=UPI0036CF8F9D